MIKATGHAAKHRLSQWKPTEIDGPKIVQERKEA